MFSELELIAQIHMQLNSGQKMVEQGMSDRQAYRWTQWWNKDTLVQFGAMFWEPLEFLEKKNEERQQQVPRERK